MKDAFAGEQLVQDRAEAENVAPMVGRHAAHLLRAHVPRRAHDHSHLSAYGDGFIRGTGVCGLHFRQPEIQSLRPPVAGEQDVVGLEIAMHDAGVMSGGESAGDLRGHFEGLTHAELTAA